MSCLDGLPLPCLLVHSHSAHHFQVYVLRFRFFICSAKNQPSARSPHPSETSRATQKEPLSINQLTAGDEKALPTDHVLDEDRSCSMVLHFPVVHLRDRMVGSSDMVNHV